MAGSLDAFCDALFSNPAYQPLDVTANHVRIAHSARPNDDPFDALICAAATAEGLALITRDGEITDSGIVEIIW